MDDPPESEPGPDPVGPPSRPRLILTGVFFLAGAFRGLAAEPTPAEIEKQMFGLVNQARRTHQKKPLTYDARLAAVARAHSTDMSRNAFFAHRSPRTGLVGERLWAAKIKVLAAAENIALNQTVEIAHRRLMDSAGHRKNLLSDILTHIGIGIVKGPGRRYYVTQVFATPAPEVPLKGLRDRLLKDLNQARVARGRLPFQANPTLGRLAGEVAAETARAGRAGPVDISARAKAAGFKHQRLSMARVRTFDPREIATAAALFKPRLGRIGLGVGENTTRPDLGYGIFWVVAIYTDE